MQIRWLRRLIRRNTSPIKEEVAGKWKTRLSLAYMLLAWNAFGFVAYAWHSGQTDWAHYYGLKSDEEKAIPNNEYFARALGRGNIKLVTIKGLKSIEIKDFVNDDEAADEAVADEEDTDDYRKNKIVETLKKIRSENELTQ